MWVIFICDLFWYLAMRETFPTASIPSVSPGVLSQLSDSSLQIFPESSKIEIKMQTLLIVKESNITCNTPDVMGASRKLTSK